MLPTQIVTRDYRGYAGEHALELRPLTLLFGRNNAGKSALLRALPFLAASARASGAQALDMTCPVVGRGAFDDLRWPFPNGAELPHGMGLGLRWPDGRGLDLAFAWYDRKWIYVAGIRLDGEANPWHVALPPRGIQQDRALTFRRRDAPESEGFRARFEGLQPTNLEGAAPPGLEELAKRLVEFGDEVQWLGASRRPADRLAEYNELRADPRIAHDGTNIIAWLVEHPEALASINAWYQGTINARLDVPERPPVGYEATLTHLGRPELTVNLLDTGEGNIQVLPVLAALAAAEAGTGPAIVALEEPESHLHPRLQMALAERIRRVLEGEQDVRVILETHSEHLLLALQKLVLTGFPRDHLGLYWVEQLADGRTIASPVELGSDGALGPNWPPGVFDDTLELAAELTTLQLERGGPG